MNFMYLSHKNLIKIPSDIPKFCDSYFDIHNNMLSSLKGSPINVNGYFRCSSNILKNLIGSPKIVNGNFTCSDNNLTTLKGSPKSVNDFICYRNVYLKSLKYAPKNINGDFSVADNYILTDLAYVWNSKITSFFKFSNSFSMAILPIIKFDIICFNKNLKKIMTRNKGTTKQNIINCQYDLIENGYSDNAKWKPD